MKRYLMLALGWLCFALGMIGVIIPILPTTPFILLAGFLFARSSTRWEIWIKKLKVYQKYVVPFKRNQGFTLRQKGEILCTTYALLLISGILINHTHIRLFLLVIAVVKLLVLWRFIPTVRQEEVTE